MTAKQPTSRFCFVCGRQNPHSLKMEWHNDPENGEIRGSVTVPEQYNGYPGIVHGGIVAAILDETSGRAVLLSGDTLMVTLKLEVTYRRPTPTNTPLTAIGRVVRQSTGRARVEGELHLPDGRLTATCAAVVVKPPKEISDAWEGERPYFKVYDSPN